MSRSTDAHLAQLGFYRSVISAEQDLVGAVIDFFDRLPESHVLGRRAEEARQAGVAAARRLHPLLGTAGQMVDGQIAALMPPPIDPPEPVATDAAVTQSGDTSEEAKAAADQLAIDQAATDQPATEVKAGDNAV